MWPPSHPRDILYGHQDVYETNEGYTVVILHHLQRNCIKKCLEQFKPSYAPTIPDELADEENDPFSPSRPRPSFPPPLVSTVCVM